MEASRAGADIMASNGIDFKYPSYVQDIRGPMCFDYGFGPFRWVCTSGKPEDLEKTDVIACKVLEEIKASSPEEIVITSYSIHYTKLYELMYDVMQQGKRKYYNRFKLKYHLLLALNYNYSNQQEKAISLLETFIIPKHPDLESLLDIYLSLVMFYIQKSDLKKAKFIFSKFYHTDKYYTEKAGKA